MIIGRFFPEIGGAEHQAELLSKKLIELGVRVEIYTSHPRSIPAHLPNDPLPIHRLSGIGVGWIRRISFIIALYHALITRRPKPDILHSHLAMHPAFAAVMAGRYLDVPVIVKCGNAGSRFALNLLCKQFPYGRMMAKSIAQRASRFIALNPQTEVQLSDWGIPQSRIVHIPNGVLIDDKVTQQEKATARNKLGIALNAFIVVGVGSLKTKKDFSTLVRATKYLTTKSPTQIILVGDGPQRPKLKDEASLLGINKQVRFAGWVPADKVRTYLAAADVFILPSRTEGMSNALLEAMSSGLPCVVSNIAGNNMLINHQENGLCFEPGNATQLAEYIELIRQQPEYATKLGQHAYESVFSKYGINTISKQYLELYDNLRRVR